MNATMKAVVYKEYGAPDVLRVQEVHIPALRDDEVLIRIRATSVTTGDVNLRGFTFIPRGFGLMTRLMFGLNKPKKSVLGIEFAGDIAAVGKAVTRFKVGDQVFGIDSSRMGSYAEYKAIPENAALVIKPAHVSYEDAAAFPNGALTAYTFLRKMASIQPGQQILVYGASGSVGTAAIQLAKAFGAEITGVCSARNAELVKSLGADHIIDYTREDFTRNGKTYEIIFDTVGKTSFGSVRASLRPGGFYLAGAGGLREMLQSLSTSIFGSRKVKAGPSSESREDLEAVTKLLAAGTIRPVVDRSYPLAEIVEAHRYVDSGRKRGNIVITVHE